MSFMETRPLASMVGAITVALMLVAPISTAGAGEPGRVTSLLTQPLADVPGKEVTMITVDYAPGRRGSGPPTRRARVHLRARGNRRDADGGRGEGPLRPGQTFYEDPERVHLVGRNTSDTKPAKMVVLLVKNQGTPLLVPVDR